MPSREAPGAPNEPEPFKASKHALDWMLERERELPTIRKRKLLDTFTSLADFAVGQQEGVVLAEASAAGERRILICERPSKRPWPLSWFDRPAIILLSYQPSSTPPQRPPADIYEGIHYEVDPGEVLATATLKRFASHKEAMEAFLAGDKAGFDEGVRLVVANVDNMERWVDWLRSLMIVRLEEKKAAAPAKPVRLVPPVIEDYGKRHASEILSDYTNNVGGFGEWMARQEGYEQAFDDADKAKEFLEHYLTVMGGKALHRRAEDAPDSQ